MSTGLSDICRTHLEFMHWADAAVLAAAQQQNTFYPTLAHIYQGERVWIRRILGEPNIQITDIESPATNEALAELWPPLREAWTKLAATADWDQIVPHRNIHGKLFEFPIWKMTLHVVNHGSYHRGQIVLRMREAGFTPPTTDLIAYYRL